jgi:glutathione S-transferase
VTPKQGDGPSHRQLADRPFIGSDYSIADLMVAFGVRLILGTR